MNTENKRSVCIGAIFDAVNAATGVANVHFAASVFGLFRMPATHKERTLTTNEGSTLLFLGFFGRYFAEASFTKFFTGFLRSDKSRVFRELFSMLSSQMLGSRKAFKVFEAIVGLVSVYVMNMLGGVKIVHPANRHNAVYKSISAQRQISTWMFVWGMRDVLSKNFPAARYSVKVIKGTVLDAVHCKANHAGPFNGDCVVIVNLT